MHVHHPVFEAPTDAEIPIWRYMDLAKFLSMLDAEALHFARTDLMSDEFEGSITKPTLELRRESMAEMPDEHFAKWNAGLAQVYKGYRQYHYLNCWHMSEHESAAMWSIYQSGEPQGIAVRSTYRRLSESINDQRTAYIGTVSYVDFDSKVIPDNNAYYPYVHKRRSFEYEREIRALHFARRWVEDVDAPIDDSSDIPIVKDAPVGPPVLPMSVDVDRLIEAVYVSPKAQDWFAELIRSLLLRYGRDWPVHHSNLDADPIF
jgi:hypothetical protein